MLPQQYNNAVTNDEVDATKQNQTFTEVTIERVTPKRALKASDKKVDKRQQGRAPFNTSACRFFEDHKLETPGVGSYNLRRRLCKKVEYQQSFGGKPVNLPSISLHSTIPTNTSKLVSTNDENRFNRRLAYLKLFY